jgi:uncharacterized repeat protein (TIGR01451 family)
MRKALAGAVALAISVVIVTPAAATVTPPTAALTIPAGASDSTPATVGVPALPARVDVEIAIDTTGSMGLAIDQAKDEATNIVTAVQAVVPDARFAVVDFKDAGDPLNPEYTLRQPMTADAAAVASAIGAMSPGGGGDTPEAYNLVFHNAYDDDATGWRADARKFVVVIGDAGPHVPDPVRYPDCVDIFDTADPNGLDTHTELAALAASQRTLMMIATPDSGFELCYGELVADGFSGSAASVLGGSIATQLVDLIAAASASVSVVDMTVAAAPPGADASWISFAPASTGPVDTPASVPFTVTATVPPGTPAGDYPFDLEGRADGGDVGHMTLTVTVPPAPDTGEVTITKTVDQDSVERGDRVTYTITIHNGTAEDVRVRRVVDLLPRKFRYVSGSSTGGGRPKVRHSHRQLTWRPRGRVAAGEDLVITFSARVRLRDGCGLNRAWAKLGDYTVLRTGPTARVCVTGGDDDEDHHGHGHGGGDQHGGEDHGGGDNQSGDDDASGGHGYHG